MSVFNRKKIEKRIKLNQMREKEKFLYFFILSVLTSLSLFDSLFGSQLPENNWSNISYFIISIAGIFLCYKTNKRGDNIEFIERFILISLPIILRHLVGLLFILIISVIIIKTLHLNFPSTSGLLFTPHIFTLSCFFSIKKSLHYISGQR